MSRRKMVFIGIAAVIVILAGIGIYNQVTAMSYGGFVRALRTHGATVEERGSGQQPFLRGTDHRLMVNGEGVDVFEYHTPWEAGIDARGISSDGTMFSGGIGPFHSAVTVDYVGPPHWFRQGRVIVFYVGRQQDTLALLSSVVGSQFAGLSL